MLTGQAPFNANGSSALMAMQVYEQPPSLCKIEPTVSVAAEALVLSMLAKDPTERPTMSEVAATIERLGSFLSAMLPAIKLPSADNARSSGPVVPADAMTVLGIGEHPDPARPQGRRTRRALVILPLAIILIGLGIGAYVLQSSRHRHQPASKPSQPIPAQVEPAPQPTPEPPVAKGTEDKDEADSPKSDDPSTASKKQKTTKKRKHSRK
jgi:hypothetical protein